MVVSEVPTNRLESPEARTRMNAEIRIVTSTGSLLYIQVRVEGTVRRFLEVQTHNCPHHDAVSRHQTRLV